MERNFHATSCFSLGASLGSRALSGAPASPGEHWGKASSERCDQNLQSPGSLGQVQKDAGKEGEVGRVFRKGENQGQVS